jgi:long-chain fatty acid transport protein
MGGAAVAAPLDAAGAMHWNPATLSGLETSEVVIGVELLCLSTWASSSVPGLGSDQTLSDSGLSALPTLAIALHNDDSPWTFGLGLFSIGGFGVNYPASLTNPVLAPRGLGGAGNVYSRLQVLQLVPSAAVQVTERLSLGFAPTVAMADAALDPGGLDLTTTPPSYVAATHGRLNWGLGFQAGMYYVTEYDWRFGLSYKSPQWFETFNFNATNAAGFPQLIQARLDYPSITSLGVAYYGVPGLVWDVDFRYVDYANAGLFGGDPGYDASGNLTGLGWRSVFSVATGVQYQWTEALSTRLGYVYTENPISADLAATNLAAPAIYQHILALGATWRVTCRTSISLAYLHAFENSIQGPLTNWSGQTIGTVGSRQTIDALVAGLEVKF